MNKEAKVGALVIFFMLGALLFVFWIKGNPFKRTRTLNVLFDNVHGVSVGSLVEYAGLECGKVKNFMVTPSGVVARILINNSEVKIYEGDQFMIAPSSTIASEYQIFIVPTHRSNREVSDNSTIIGQSPPGIQDFLFEAEKTLAQIQAILDGINESINYVSPVFKKVGQLANNGTIDRVATNIADATDAMKGASTTADRFLRRNDAKFQNAVDNFSSASREADQKLKAINSNEVKQAVSSMRKASQNIEAITGAVEPAEVRKDLKTFSDAAQQVSVLSKKLQSPNPNEDVPTLIKNTAQRADTISAGLEEALRGKSLLRGLMTRVSLKPKGKRAKAPVASNAGLLDKAKDTVTPADSAKLELKQTTQDKAGNKDSEKVEIEVKD
jgi:ABC-type transporter Mla subunit MlaD